LAALVLPAAQPAPGAAAQAPLQAEVVRPAALPYTPAGQALQTEAPAPEKAPGGHGEQVALEAAPVAALAVPGGQGEGVTEESGQKPPAGQITGAPLAQKKEAGQGTQVSWRTRWLNCSATYTLPLASTAVP
jgi:hypothetical protein